MLEGEARSMSMVPLRMACIAVVVLLAANTSVAQDVLFGDGGTEWAIHVSADPDPTETYAAAELQSALKKISGADFEVIAGAGTPGPNTIVVGGLGNPAVRAQATALKLSPGKVEQVAVYALGDRLYLAGNRPRGALYAVYSFLQRELGVRWLWPGPDGEFMPPKATWSLPDLAYNHAPAIPYRGFHLCGDWRDHQVFREWMARNFINIHRHGARTGEEGLGFYSMWSSHNARLKDQSLFEQHPEYFAEVDGVRYRENICLSHPAVEALVVESMAEYIRKRSRLDILSIYPSDNQTYCRCAKCGAMDVSTAWFSFYNRLTDVLKRRFPELRCATIAYQGFRDVPACAIRNTEFVEYATYMRCNTHPYGHPDCPRNEKIMAALLEWQATGVAIGNYAYEYDIFSSNRRFVPFLTMIDDAIKTSKQLGHVTMIPEILLSPKLGPETYVGNVQNRLSIYLYARLLWDPDQDMQEILRDWCRTAFGGAAGPMFDYYMHMDRAWTAMPDHTGILGNALRVAEPLLAGALREEAAADFLAADQAASEIQDPVLRERVVAAIAREKVLFGQWLDLQRIRSAETSRVNLPLVAKEEGFSPSSCRAQSLGSVVPDTESHPTEVRAAWTRDALLINWLCRDPQTGLLKTQAVERDNDVCADDSVEVVLSGGVGGEAWHLALNAKGVMQDYRVSNVGVREDRWDPEWRGAARVEADHWEAEMAIPFASLGQGTPNPNETWQARFLRHNGGRKGVASSVFPARDKAILFFNAADRTDRALLWWCGAPQREAARVPSLSQTFAQAGWQFNHVTNGNELVSLHAACDTFWFRHPNGPNKPPADYWREHLVPAVSNGAVAVFVSYWDIPLEQYFDDTSFNVKVVSCGKIPLAGRRSAFIAPGEWSTTPNNLLRRLQHKITPAYGFVPGDPDAWEILATAPRRDNKAYPYVLVRRYGKGMVVLCGDNIPIPADRMLENFVAYHDRQNLEQ